MGAEPQVNNPFLMGDKTYNFVKKLTQIILPAFGTFYVTLGHIWGLPYGDQVAGTILALCTFLGICLGISSAQYTASGAGFQGHLTIQPNEEGISQVKAVHFDGETKDLEEKTAVTFKIHRKASSPVEEQIEDEFDDALDPPVPPHKQKATRKSSKS